MLIEYIHTAMTKATYEKLEDGTYSGKVPNARVWLPLGRHSTSVRKSCDLLLRDG